MNENKKHTIPPSPVPALTATFRSQSLAAANLQHVHFPLLRPNNNGSSSSSSSSKSGREELREGKQTLALNHRLGSKKRAAPSATPLANSASSIQEVPPMYMLDHNCFSMDEKDSSTVSALIERIVEFLRVQSISYTSENGNTGCCLSCTTASRLNFVIQLWRNNRAGKILVEVQRRRGCSIEMNSIRRSLIQQVSSSSSSENKNETKPCRRGAGSSMACNKRPRTIPPQTALLNCEDALQISLRLIESHKVDQQQLGWESLTFLTNPLYCSMEDAQLVSNTTIQGEGALGARLHQALANVLGRNANDNKVNGDKRSLVHHLALQTLANALEQATAVNPSSKLWQSILETLLRNLERATQSPQEAAWSAKCIRVLLPWMRREGVSLLQQVDASTLQGLASRALDYGKARHLSLEREATSLLQTIL